MQRTFLHDILTNIRHKKEKRYTKNHLMDANNMDEFIIMKIKQETFR